MFLSAHISTAEVGLNYSNYSLEYTNYDYSGYSEIIASANVENCSAIFSFSVIFKLSNMTMMIRCTIRAESVPRIFCAQIEAGAEMAAQTLHPLG
ncbi:MAG: hypothetical protein JKX69_03685 [Rhodobacteraceae bacterium]|nr:hypothetical protein [Paracoccaceae bacterium]